MIIRDYLHSQHVGFESFLHRPAPTATHLASHVHVTGRRVAKGVLIHKGDGFVLAVLPATRRVDLDKIAQLLGGPSARLADEREIVAIFDDCERGAVPPFGRPYGLTTIVDASLADGGPEIVCVGNQRHEGVRLSYRDFERLESPTVARFAAAETIHDQESSRLAG